MVFSAETWLVAAVLESLETLLISVLILQGNFGGEVLDVIFISPETVSYPDGSGREFEDMHGVAFLSF